MLCYSINSYSWATLTILCIICIICLTIRVEPTALYLICYHSCTTTTLCNACKKLAMVAEAKLSIWSISFPILLLLKCILYQKLTCMEGRLPYISYSTKVYWLICGLYVAMPLKLVMHANAPTVWLQDHCIPSHRYPRHTHLPTESPTLTLVPCVCMTGSWLLWTYHNMT